MTTQAKTTKSINYAGGEQLLNKAVASEKDSRRYYGMYVQWAGKHQIPADIIVSQLVKAKGWTVKLAMKYANGIILLNEAGNVKHLEDLLNGEISFDIAIMRVAPTASSGIVYNDEETATRCLQKAFTIMRHRNKSWTQAEILVWVTNILVKFLSGRP